jgi:uncharacterized protein YbdZ (MbtH family)
MMTKHRGASKSNPETCPGTYDVCVEKKGAVAYHEYPSHTIYTIHFVQQGSQYSLLHTSTAVTSLATGRDQCIDFVKKHYCRYRPTGLLPTR